jgi:hypothetical protein
MEDLKMKNSVIWKEWCKRVEKHNENIDYVNWEEAWTPHTIFTPFIFSVLTTLLSVLLAIGLFGVHYVEYERLLFVPVVSFVVYSFCLWMNWTANEPK